MTYENADKVFAYVGICYRVPDLPFRRRSMKIMEVNLITSWLFFILPIVTVKAQVNPGILRFLSSLPASNLVV